MKRIGILTSGGDCQALNATMRGVAKTLYASDKDVEIIGFIDGYKGLIYGDYREMKPSDFEPILSLGGTILGTSRQPFKLMRKPDENGLDKVEAMKDNYKKLKLDALVVLGGNGSMKTANLLSEEGLNVIGLPKTIDNDIWGTEETFGFQSAVEIATDSLDRIKTTASSHSRVFVVEIMGHKVGWVTLYAGIAAGVSAILLPEIPYDIEKLARLVKKRAQKGEKYTIIAAAEGAVTKEDADLSKKDLKAKREGAEVVPVCEVIGKQLADLTGLEVRTTNPGHIQRGGAPNAYDRVLSSRLGAEGGCMVLDKAYGCTAAVKGTEIIRVPLKDIAGKLKYVDPEGSVVRAARAMGISFGD